MLGKKIAEAVARELATSKKFSYRTFGPIASLLNQTQWKKATISYLGWRRSKKGRGK